ncbi:MAG: FAD-dependent oxidoreductase [Acidobacteriota bacterium]
MRVAVVGAGIAGLAAAHELARTPGAEVHVFDAAPRPGGHAYTVDVEENGATFPVDLGFIVYNEPNYPVFSRLLRDLDVETVESSMGFSVSDRGTGIEYSGENARSMLAAPGNALKPQFWSMLRDLRRFWREGDAALAALDAGENPGTETLGAFCDRARLGEPFRRLFLRPMAGAIWSMPRRDIDAFPALTLLRFFHNHGLLAATGQPAWRTVRGGSRSYVTALVGTLTALGVGVHLGAAIERVERDSRDVTLRIAGQQSRFDEVVFACHSDTALELLGDADTNERSILGAIRYREQDVVLHCDRSLLPRHRRAWASWNVSTGGRESDPIAISYWMNRLQPLPTETPWCVTLNQSERIEPATIRHRLVFAHPQLDLGAVAAQARWSEISGHRHTHFCGAYWRYGFHEDGAWSGVRAATGIATSRREAQ